MFYENIEKDPDGGLSITVEVYQGFDPDFGRKVRTLNSGRFRFGDSWWYLNSRDDAGRRVARTLTRTS